MRSSLLISLSLLLTLPLLDFAPLRQRSDKHPPLMPTSNLCEDATSHRREMSIEDGLLRRKLLREGSLLIQNGRATPAKKLVEQLERAVASIDLPATKQTATDPLQLIQASRASIVVVSGFYKCSKCDQMHAGTASGFVIASEGIIVTNHHVISTTGYEAIVVMTADNRVFPVEEVLAGSRSHDLAILRVPAKDLVPLPILASSAEAPPGTPVTVISHPDGQYYTCTAGIVSRYFRIRSENEVVDALGITADYARGSSGAPVLDTHGQVVGIVKSTESIYYTETSQQQRDLQMVFKTCIPGQSLMRMIKPASTRLQAATATSERIGRTGI